MSEKHRMGGVGRYRGNVNGACGSLRDAVTNKTEEFAVDELEPRMDSERTTEYTPRVRWLVRSSVAAGGNSAATERIAPGQVRRRSSDRGASTMSLETAYHFMATVVRRLRETMRGEFDSNAPPHEPGRARAERWVRMSVERASDEYKQRNYSSAVVALDVGMDLAPHAALAAQMMDLSTPIYHIYQSVIGDLGAVAKVVVPIAALDSRDVDHQMAFLLSRLDGVVTVDEFLHVVGLSRFEAMHHLSMMMLKGVIYLSS